MIESLLRNVKRRYRLPPLPSLTGGTTTQGGHAATALAIAIEHARRALAEGRQPEPEAKSLFVNALAALIRVAMDSEAGDAAIQAMVLRHHDPVLREYASLSADARADRRRVLHLVNSVAHPAKLERSSSAQIELLTQVHALATEEAWVALADTLRSAQDGGVLPEPLGRVLESPALRRLLRLDALSGLESVRRYQALRAQMGPEARSEDAMADGSASHKRGAAVEAAAAKVMEGFAAWLNERAGSEGPHYRVVTSMRAPATLPADHRYAKTEWDVVLLEQVMAQQVENARGASAEQSATAGAGISQNGGVSATDVWKVALLLEAKASVDAAATDLPRLIRGLHLMAQADENEVYVFQSRQGAVPLHGASLKLLANDETGLDAAVLYCSNGPDQTAPRLLSAASRMQLLSAPASLEYAARVSAEQTACLESVWHELLTQPRWHAVLNQYPTLCRALELMVHVADLERAIPRTSDRF